MSFSEPGGEDENLFQLVRRIRLRVGREFNGIFHRGKVNFAPSMKRLAFRLEEFSAAWSGKRRPTTPPGSRRRWRINFFSRSRLCFFSSGICSASSEPTRRNCTDVRRPEKFPAAGPEGSGHSRCAGRQRGGDRLRRNARQRRHHSRNLFRHGFHLDDFAGAQSHPWRRTRIGTGGRNTSFLFFCSSGSGSRYCFAFNIIVFGETLAGIAEVNFQLGVPLQEWVSVLNLPFTGSR